LRPNGFVSSARIPSDVRARFGFKHFHPFFDLLESLGCLGSLGGLGGCKSGLEILWSGLCAARKKKT